MNSIIPRWRELGENNVELEVGGKKQHMPTRVHKNIILASYSPASLVLPKLSYPKYIREMHHLKVTVCKYLHSHNHHAMIHKNQYDMNKVIL